MKNLYALSIVEYCERLGNSIFSEPINLFSNLAFLFSAYLIFKLFKKHKKVDAEYWILFWLVISIGLGSALWHSFRTPLAHAFDAIPIYLFLLTYLYLFLKNLLDSKGKSVVIVITYLFLQIGVSILFPEVFNGSIRHIVNALFFVALSLWIYIKAKGLNLNFILALLAYMLGIVFRTTDNKICIIFPVGTHFLWHILTALASYFAIKALTELKRRVK